MLQSHGIDLVTMHPFQLTEAVQQKTLAFAQQLQERLHCMKQRSVERKQKLSALIGSVWKTAESDAAVSAEATAATATEVTAVEAVQPTCERTSAEQIVLADSENSLENAAEWEAETAETTTAGQQASVTNYTDDTTNSSTSEAAISEHQRDIPTEKSVSTADAEFDQI